MAVGGAGLESRAGTAGLKSWALRGADEESPQGVGGVMTDDGTGSHGPDWTGGREAVATTASTCSASFLQAHTPSHPVSHPLCQTRQGHWERAAWGRVGRRGTPLPSS